tara:strand:- start:1209 stop:1391 length:183 start_codon:yes stop_codon:yes gene_type:complete
MEYPTLIKSTNKYLMYQYFGSGMLEIVDMNSNFRRQYMGYGIQESVRLFKKELKEKGYIK